MADDIAATPAAAEQVQDAVQPEQTAQPNATGGGTQPERTFTQADVDRMIADRLDRERKSGETKAQKAREDAERKAAEQQGEYQKLYQQEKALREQAEAERKALELAKLRREVADKLGLPAGLVDRLRGESAEDVEADARELLKALPKPAAPNINATGGGAQTNGALWSEEERKRLAALYHVNHKNFGTVAGD